jgi:hypothetical protein
MDSRRLLAQHVTFQDMFYGSHDRVRCLLAEFTRFARGPVPVDGNYHHDKVWNIDVEKSVARLTPFATHTRGQNMGW